MSIYMIEVWSWFNTRVCGFALWILILVGGGAGLNSVACAGKPLVAIANPWVDCGQDMDCAERAAGFTFPVRLSNFQMRAMYQVIEIEFYLDANRKIFIRKSESCSDDLSLSGDYNSYQFNGELMTSTGLHLRVRGDNSKIYVVNFATAAGHYACNCPAGMTIDEVYNLCQLIRESEN